MIKTNLNSSAQIPGKIPGRPHGSHFSARRLIGQNGTGTVLLTNVSNRLEHSLHTECREEYPDITPLVILLFTPVFLQQESNRNGGSICHIV